MVAPLYAFVKSLPREDGGLKYNAQEAWDYLFQYMQKEDGTSYSLKGSSGIMHGYEKLKKTSEGIKARFDPEKFHGISTAKLDAIASNVYRDYIKNQSADSGALKEILSGIFADVKEGTDWNELQKKAYSAASEILREAVSVNDDLHMAYKAMSKILRETGISLSENGLGTLTGYDGLQDFRRKHFGKILFKQAKVDANSIRYFFCLLLFRHFCAIIETTAKPFIHRRPFYGLPHLFALQP